MHLILLDPTRKHISMVVKNVQWVLGRHDILLSIATLYKKVCKFNLDVNGVH